MGVAHRERHAVVVLRQRRRLRAPAQVDQAGLGRVAPLDGVEQALLDVVLRQVDHRRQGLARIGGHLEAEHLVGPVEAAADRPRQALGQEARQRAEPLDDLQAAARHADRAAAHAHRVVGLQQHAAHAVVGQSQRQRHADRAGAGDDHRMPAGLAAAFERRRAGRVARVVEGAHGRRRRARVGRRRQGALGRAAGAGPGDGDGGGGGRPGGGVGGVAGFGVGRHGTGFSR
jgi:hypothetical protein